MPVSGPGWKPSQRYYDCRYAVLREPLGFPRGAEILADDEQALHAWVKDGDTIIAVGRSHVIPNDSDGSQADHAGPGAAHCPAFGPLIDGVVLPRCLQNWKHPRFKNLEQPQVFYKRENMQSPSI